MPQNDTSLALFFYRQCCGELNIKSMKRKLEARRRRLLKAVDTLWMGVIIGDAEKARMEDQINKEIDDCIKHLIDNKVPQIEMPALKRG